MNQTRVNSVRSVGTDMNSVHQSAAGAALDFGNVSAWLAGVLVWRDI